jgi:predicted HTH transcriptional regulator
MDKCHCIFTAIIHRKEIARTGVSTTTPGKTPGKILDLLEKNPHISLPEVAKQLGKSDRAIERAVTKLRKAGELKRIGPAKGGHWEVVKRREE